MTYDEAVTAARKALGTALKRTGTQNGWPLFRGPCPICGGDDRFRVAQGDTAVIVKCSHDCSFQGLLEAIGLHNSDRQEVPNRVRREAAPQTERENEPGSLVAAAWERSQPAAGTPLETYLVDRRLWPADETGGWESFVERGGHWPPHPDTRLPAALGWIPASVSVDTGRNIALPDNAAGWAVYLFQRPGSPVASALQLEAISARGVRREIAYTRAKGDTCVLRKRISMPGSRFPNGVVFTVRRGRGQVHVTEGPPDAFALLALEWLHAIDLEGGTVVAAAGTDLLAKAVAGPGEPVTVWAQRDANSAGQRAALKARQAIRERTQREVRIKWALLGRDWADLAWARGGN